MHLQLKQSFTQNLLLRKACDTKNLNKLLILRTASVCTCLKIICHSKKAVNLYKTYQTYGSLQLLAALYHVPLVILKRKPPQAVPLSFILNRLVRFRYHQPLLYLTVFDGSEIHHFDMIKVFTSI